MERFACPNALPFVCTTLRFCASHFAGAQSHSLGSRCSMAPIESAGSHDRMRLPGPAIVSPTR